MASRWHLYFPVQIILFNIEGEITIQRTFCAMYTIHVPFLIINDSSYEAHFLTFNQTTKTCS